MGVEALAPGLGAIQHPAADHLENVAGRGAINKQMPLSRLDNDLVRAIGLRGHDRLPAFNHAVSRTSGNPLHACTGDRPAGTLFDHLAAEHHTARKLDVFGRLDRPFGICAFVGDREIRLTFGRKHFEFEPAAGGTFAA